MSKPMYDTYKEIFEKFKKVNGYSIFDIATNEQLRKEHYEKNKKIVNTDTEQIQRIYEKIGLCK